MKWLIFCTKYFTLPYICILINILLGPGETEDIPGIGQYEDFHTIDWQRDIARDRMRHRYILKRKQHSLIELVIWL